MCRTNNDCLNGETCINRVCTKQARRPRWRLAALALLLTSCGVTLAQVGQLGAVVTGHAARCTAERAAGPQPTTPRCDAARRCAAAAEGVIMSESPARDQFAAAMTICEGKK